MERVAFLAARIPGASAAVEFASGLEAPAKAAFVRLLEAIAAAAGAGVAPGTGPTAAAACPSLSTSERTGTGFALLQALPWTSPRAKADVEVCEDAWLLHGTKAGTVEVRPSGLLERAQGVPEGASRRRRGEVGASCCSELVKSAASCSAPPAAGEEQRCPGLLCRRDIRER